MACYRYKIASSGGPAQQGTYKKCGESTFSNWSLQSGSEIILECTEEFSIFPGDSQAFGMFASLTKLDNCTPTPPPPSGCDLEILEAGPVPANGPNSPTGAVLFTTSGLGALQYSEDGVTWRPVNVIVNLLPGNYIGYVRKLHDHSCIKSKAFTIGYKHASIFATAATTKNVTVIGGSDGEVTVNIIEGSGHYVVTFDHDDIAVPVQSGAKQQSLTKTGLPVGVYSATVEDIVTGEEMVVSAEVTQPIFVPPVEAPENNSGDFLEVPILNSFHFVRENLNALQTPDNRLLINQYHPGFTKTNYCQPVVKDQLLTTQFYTNYRASKCELFNYISKALVKTFLPAELIEKNVGITKDFNVRIINHNIPGKSRVYFASGPPEIPLFVSKAFQILNNAYGYNGTYLPEAIEMDMNLGYQYIVINKQWTLDSSISSVSGTGRFDVSFTDFNVYQFKHTFEDVPNGVYFMKLTAFDLNSSIVFTTEPINIQVSHPKHLKLQYTNVDNAFGMTFSKGYVGTLWIPAILGHKRSPGGERALSRNSDFSLVKVSAKKQRLFDLETFLLPPYMHEKLSVIFDCDYWTINGVPYQSSESYETPAYLNRSLLASSRITIETRWFDKYNSDDLGTVSSGGFIRANGRGYIKR